MNVKQIDRVIQLYSVLDSLENTRDVALEEPINRMLAEIDRLRGEQQCPAEAFN